MADKFQRRKLTSEYGDLRVELGNARTQNFRDLEIDFEVEALGGSENNVIETEQALAPVFQFVIGRHSSPGIAFTSDDLSKLRDPFGSKVLNKGFRPQTVDELLSIFDSDASSDAVSKQFSFVLGEGGQIPWTEDTKDLQRSLRFVVVRQNDQNDEVMLSVDDKPSSPFGLLQLLAWDPVKKAYNFYQRKDGFWFFVGDSNDALRPDSAGKGPFDGHVNGSLVMKELRFPWLHWSSEAEKIDISAFRPNHPIISHKIFQEKVGAEIFERRIIVPGIDKWTEARIERSIKDGKLSSGKSLLRQIVIATSVNIVSAPDPTQEIERTNTVKVPWEILLNKELWSRRKMLNDDIIGSPIEISGAHYLDAVNEIGMKLFDETSGYEVSGDTFFPMACPSPAYEDLSVTRALISSGIIRMRLVQALSSVDFTNPIQSHARERFAAYLPETGISGVGPNSIERQIVDVIKPIAVANPSSDEAAVLQILREKNDQNARTLLSNQVSGYISNVRQKLSTREGVLELVRLIDSRRRYFRALGISEFPLTLPFSNISNNAGFLRMKKSGVVEQVTT